MDAYLWARWTGIRASEYRSVCIISISESISEMSSP
jgi:hypothetical protein